MMIEIVSIIPVLLVCHLISYKELKSQNVSFSFNVLAHCSFIITEIVFLTLVYSKTANHKMNIIMDRILIKYFQHNKQLKIFCDGIIFLQLIFHVACILEKHIFISGTLLNVVIDTITFVLMAILGGQSRRTLCLSLGLYHFFAFIQMCVLMDDWKLIDSHNSDTFYHTQSTFILIPKVLFTIIEIMIQMEYLFRFRDRPAREGTPQLHRRSFSSQY